MISPRIKREDVYIIIVFLPFMYYIYIHFVSTFNVNFCILLRDILAHYYIPADTIYYIPHDEGLKFTKRFIPY